MRKNGEIRHLHVFRKEIFWNGRKQSQIVYQDITERKQAEEALRENEEKYRTILENIQEGYFEVDPAGNFTFFNDSTCFLLGYSKEELMGMNYRQYTDKEHSKKVFQTYNKIYNTGKPAQEFDWQVIRKDGTRRYIEQSVSLQKDSSGKPTGFRGIVHDVTERKRAEEKLKQTFIFQQRLIDALPVPVFFKDSEGRYLGCNSSFEKFFGRKREHLTGKSVYDLSPKEIADTYHEKDLALLQNPGIQIYESIVKDMGGVVHNVIFHKATFPNMDGSVGGLIGAILDITERKKAEEELQKTLESLRKAVGATIQVMVSAIEMRDPYTAGHQLRSANLARAIATEMGLPQDKIDGIRMAGSVHDIGKLSIPAEILSKPTKLTNLEFSLIKEHSQIGYEMLKNVESPWPLAQIVYQHHERMDGSGYPRNLKGDEILMEARIMAVADVVEAMASHRPYRPSLGIDAALVEIEKNKGTQYDNTVADACLRLFREKGYQLT